MALELDGRPRGVRGQHADRGEYILDTEVANMNPYVTAGTKSSLLRGLTYDPLIYFNPIDGTYVPMLATEWAFNEDYTSISVHAARGRDVA